MAGHMVGKRLSLCPSPLSRCIIALGVQTGSEIERVITEFAAGGNGGRVGAPHAITLENRDVIIRLASDYRLPAVFGPRYYATSGGLVAYGPKSD
jgi:putative ABC transport system substrate-binding protein